MIKGEFAKAWAVLWGRSSGAVTPRWRRGTLLWRRESCGKGTPTSQWSCTVRCGQCPPQWPTVPSLPGAPLGQSTGSLGLASWGRPRGQFLGTEQGERRLQGWRRSRKYPARPDAPPVFFSFLSSLSSLSLSQGFP